MVRKHFDAVFDELDGQARAPPQELVHHALEVGREVLDDDEREARIVRHCSEELLERFESTGGCAHADDERLVRARELVFFYLFHGKTHWGRCGDGSPQQCVRAHATAVPARPSHRSCAVPRLFAPDVGLPTARHTFEGGKIPRSRRRATTLGKCGVCVRGGAYGRTHTTIAHADPDAVAWRRSLVSGDVRTSRDPIADGRRRWKSRGTPGELHVAADVTAIAHCDAMSEEVNFDRTRLLEFLKRNRETALAEWEAAVRPLPSATRLDLNALRDHIPELLDKLIDAIDGNQRRSLDALAVQHATTRLEQGFGLEQVAHEYQVLRSSLLRLLGREPAPLEAGALLLLNEAIDHAVMHALVRYHEARSRTLDALERVSQEAFASHGEGVREFLRRFLASVTRTFEAVDTCAIYLLERDQLVVRAAAGIEAAAEDKVATRLGEGFVGLIAQSRSARFTVSTKQDALVRSDVENARVQALYGVPLLDGADVIGVATMGSCAAVDFSDEDRQLFRDMAQRAALLLGQRRLAEEKEVFLGVLSHDLRSPLNTITMGAGYLRREQLSEPAARATQRIASAAHRMERMIDGLTDYTKLRFGGGLTIDPHIVDIGGALDQLVAEVRTQHPQLEIRLEARGDMIGEWDPVRIGQLVTNLVNNAILYGNPALPIDITANGSERTAIVITVHNQGEPIPAALLPHLFDAFQRGRTRVSGMGLGLFIVRHVARAHGGDVTVDSSRDHGTTFTVRLPRWTSAEPS